MEADAGELVFIPTPAMGHLVAAVELAKLVVADHPRISITILIPKLPIPDKNIDTYIQSNADNNHRIYLVELPPLDNGPSAAESSSKRPFFLFNLLATLYKPVVKRVVEQRRHQRPVLGILTDMFFTQMVDVAEELGLPFYVLYTSGANLLAMTLQLESLAVDVPAIFAGCPSESAPLDSVLGFRNPVPLKMWPEIVLDKDNSAEFLVHGGRYRRSKGILVNTFANLEPETLRSLSENERAPTIYPIGPVLNLRRGHRHHILSWLDEQPRGSVVFLCFGSNVSFGKREAEQVGMGIEQSGYPFLWSLRRKPLPGDEERLPSEYDDFKEILPEGFLERTSGIGRMIGWAPQTEVLGHEAVGAFVSHCGWNSVLESIRFGVPIIAWPMYREQHLNAFSVVRELGIAVEMRLDYKYDWAGKKGNVVITAAEVEAGIRRAMETEEGAAVKRKVQEMSVLGNKALDVGGSSHNSLRLFAQDLVKNYLSNN
ncbi:hypothetical protein V2J09_023045 [Rumex salicifolius]